MRVTGLESLLSSAAAVALVFTSVAQAQVDEPHKVPRERERAFELLELQRTGERSRGVSESQGRVLTREEARAGATRPSAEEMIATWKQKPREVAQKMIQKYGQPQEVTDHRLVWHENGPWKRTVVINEEIPHNFPKPHVDVLEQAINLRVPPDKFDDLAEFDGSVIVERTRGEISARCDREEANFLALNLAREIVEGKRSVDEARRLYAEAMIENKHPEYTRGFMFQPLSREQGDRDTALEIR